MKQHNYRVTIEGDFESKGKLYRLLRLTNRDRNLHVFG